MSQITIHETESEFGQFIDQAYESTKNSTTQVVQSELSQTRSRQEESEPLDNKLPKNYLIRGMTKLGRCFKSCFRPIRKCCRPECIECCKCCKCSKCCKTCKFCRKCRCCRKCMEAEEPAPIELDEKQSVDWFDLFDENGDGEIDCTEMYHTFKKIRFPITKKEIKSIYEIFDTDGNGTIDRDEFRLFMHKYLKTSQNPTINVFDEFDHDGDGKISVEEFIESLATFGGWMSVAEAHELCTPFYTDDQKLNLSGYIHCLAHCMDTGVFRSTMHDNPFSSAIW